MSVMHSSTFAGKPARRSGGLGAKLIGDRDLLTVCTFAGVGLVLSLSLATTLAAQPDYITAILTLMG